jgi:hypothetical protein
MSIGGESSARPNGAVRWNQRSLLLSDVRLNADPVVDCVLKALPTAEVFLGGLNRDVAEQELDLVQIPSGITTQASAGPTEVMRGQIFNFSSFGAVL